MNPHHTRYLFGHAGVRAMTARMHRAEIARARAQERGPRHAVRTVAGASAWAAFLDARYPYRPAFDSHAAHADAAPLRARAELSRRIGAAR